MSFNRNKYDFNGKVALITGSSSGIGAAIAVQLAAYGAQVTITGRSIEGLEKVRSLIKKVAPKIEPLSIIGDLTADPHLPTRLIDETVTKFGRLDFLINNAGWGTPNGDLSSDNLLSAFDNLFKLNVRVVIELTQLAVPHLEKTKGNVVNISSAASMKPVNLVYSASKAALDMVTKTSALELGPKGIRVNSINPGLVKTALSRSLGFAEIPQERLDHIASTSLLKRIGEPDDIANLASFLVSDDALNITGSIMLNDSGYMVFSTPHQSLRKSAQDAEPQKQ